MGGASQTFPEDSVQGVVDPPWWITRKSKGLERGRLVKAFLPHVQQQPQTLTPTRADDTDHTRATFTLAPLEATRVREHRKALPVAAMPLNPGEFHAVYRTKFRPCLVISAPTPRVERNLRGDASWQTAPTFLVAPYYGGDQDGTRAGFKPEFIERVRRGAYPQFFWDRLPTDGPTDSIMRLDHIQPVGLDGNSHVVTEHQLSETAIAVLDDWLTWLTTGLVPSPSDLHAILALIAAPPPPAP